MNFFSFSSLSVEARQATKDCVMKATSEAREKDRAAAREYATAITVEENGTKEGAQAPGKEPGSSKKTTHANPP